MRLNIDLTTADKELMAVIGLIILNKAKICDTLANLDKIGEILIKRF